MNKIGEVVTSLFKGRLARLDYFTSQFTVGIMLGIVLLCLSLLNTWIGIFGITSGSSLSIVQEIIVTFLLYSAFISYFTFIISIVVRRGHDIGWSAGFSILMLVISFFILIPALFLLFKKSNVSGDKYGNLNTGKYFQRIFNLSRKYE